jgi:hypothetical protein
MQKSVLSVSDGQDRHTARLAGQGEGERDFIFLGHNPLKSPDSEDQANPSKTKQNQGQQNKTKQNQVILYASLVKLPPSRGGRGSAAPTLPPRIAP